MDAQLRVTTDRQAIAEVLAAYCQRLDEYDIDAVGQIFAEDGVMDQGPGRGGPIRGRARIVAGMKERQARFRRTAHHLGQSSIRVDGSVARALTYVTAWHQTWDMQKQTAYLRYVDSLVRSPDGSWQIVHRVSQAMGVDGFDEAQWNWVDRHAPSDASVRMPRCEERIQGENDAGGH
ncbi:nuclear transport factor 2 family protein [Variovorax sp. KK3]|uniref:nuclear transport factor 2 family protein n=1 Tax=Variovorax sp. KK3 TaxID=1855728 RepID=UPI00097BCF71|nr:nuclear transport factor 2 family protein [Variovorax sp. KK3]